MIEGQIITVIVISNPTVSGTALGLLATPDYQQPSRSHQRGAGATPSFFCRLVDEVVY
jgi:hypothetical protein